MSFNPPPDPTPGLTFQYGNIIWKYDAVSGVWNIEDGNLVGERGPKGDQGDPGPTGATGATGDPSAGDGAAIIVNAGTVTARIGGYGETGVMGVTGRFGLVNGIATLLSASTGESGIASFDSQFFSVSSTGHVRLIGDLGGATGDTVLAGSGIRIPETSGNTKTIINVGVTGIGFGNDVGLTGKINLTAQSGSNITITQSSNTITIGSNFSVGATGHTVTPGVGINVVNAGGNVRRIDNMGVTSFNGLTGAVNGISTINNTSPTILSNFNIEVTGDTQAVFGYTPLSSSDLSFGISARLATASLTGVARFPATHFSVSNGAVSLSGPYGIIGVTGIAVGDNDVGLTGRVQITAGTNVTVTRSGNTITIASSGGGGAAGITASPQQVLFSSGNGGTGSNNFVFNGLAATFGGDNTQFTITGPTFTIGNNTVVRGGVFFDAAESAPYFIVPSGNFEIRGASGSVQRIRTNQQSSNYQVTFASDGWSDVVGVSESVVVIMQSESAKTGAFGNDVLTTTPRPIIGGVTGGFDVFTLMRIKVSDSGGVNPLRMAFPIARGLTAPNFSIG
jgi:hypothetical protein